MQLCHLYSELGDLSEHFWNTGKNKKVALQRELYEIGKNDCDIILLQYAYCILQYITHLGHLKGSIYTVL